MYEFKLRTLYLAQTREKRAKVILIQSLSFLLKYFLPTNSDDPLDKLWVQCTVCAKW